MENTNDNNNTASGSLERPKRQTIQLSAETYKRIKAHCNTHGLIMSVFAERAILGEIDNPKQPAIEKAFVDGTRIEKSEPPMDKSLITG